MKKILLIFILFPILVNAQISKPEQIQFISDFINCFKNDDKEKLITFISFPLDRPYPVPSINDSNEFLARYDEIFDDSLIQEIVKSDIKIDWTEMGWRGIMLNNGTLWLEPYSNKLIGINYITAKEKMIQHTLIEKDRNYIHSSLKQFNRPILIMETTKYRIRIDEMDSNQFRYASWSIDKKMNKIPDLVIPNGKRIRDGSGGNHSYVFENDKYTYDCSIIILGREDSPPAEWSVSKNENTILTEPVIRLKY